MPFNNKSIWLSITQKPLNGSTGPALVKSQSKKLMDAIEQKERELAKITRYKQAIYQDWKDGENFPF